MRDQSEPVRGSLPFGWRWIGRSLLLRRGQTVLILFMTGALYAVGLVSPVATQMAVDNIVAGRAGLELAVLAAAAVISIAVEAALYFWRQRLVIELGTFLDRRNSRRAFAHLLRLRTYGTGFSSGE